VIEFCERNFLSGMTTSNFYDFITTAKLYSMSSALRQIDTFIANNLLAIASDGTLSLLTYEQILHCLRCGTLNLHEIDIFQVVIFEELTAHSDTTSDFYSGHGTTIWLDIRRHCCYNSQYDFKLILCKLLLKTETKESDVLLKIFI